MELVNTLTSLALLAGILFMVPAFLEERAARKHTRQDAPPDAFLISPLCLFQHELYTEKGEVHRRSAVKAFKRAGFCWALFLVEFLLTSF